MAEAKKSERVTLVNYREVWRIMGDGNHPLFGEPLSPINIPAPAGFAYVYLAHGGVYMVETAKITDRWNAITNKRI